MFVAHALTVRDTKFQENPSDGNRETVEKVLFSSSEVLLSTERLQPKYTICSACMDSVRCDVSRKFL